MVKVKNAKQYCFDRLGDIELEANKVVLSIQNYVIVLFQVIVFNLIEKRLKTECNNILILPSMSRSKVKT
jgi:hypothetical protein